VLFGRRDLIDAAALNSTPNDNIGRGMKVGKEEVIGFIAALERFARTDHTAETERWNARARRIVERLQGVRGLTAAYALNTAGYGDADLTWDERDVALDRDTLRRALAGGTPRVELEVIITQDRGTTTWHATARTRVLRDGEELLVAKRLREVFEAARVRA
jgi:L-seryl-tRNA(Ser) seleniumtransferase